MPRTHFQPWKFLLAASLLLVCASGLLLARYRPVSLTASPAAKTLAAMPPVMLWAWERPEDLTHIDPQKAGVAYLANTIYLDGTAYRSRPRLQPLRVADGTWLMAVVRIESLPHAHAVPAISEAQSDPLNSPLKDITPTTSNNPLAPYTQSQLDTAVHDIVEVAQAQGVHAVQIDFDARHSERAFYAALIREVRKNLPPDVPLSITALAGWCFADHWIEGLPVDEAVPMLFQMGRETKDIRARLSDGEDFAPASCRLSLGIATDETLPRVPSGRRIYLFHNHSPWTQQNIAQAMKISEDIHAQH